MNAMRPLLMLAACVAAHAFAAEPAVPAPKPQTAQSQPAQQSAAKPDPQDAKAADGKSEADKAAAKSGDKDAGKGSPQRFIPSEQVRADFDVSFPVDI